MSDSRTELPYRRANDLSLQSRIGRLDLAGPSEIEAGAYAELALTYTCGYFGIDDTGALRVVTRFATDMGRPQFEAPDQPNYVSVEASNGAVLECRYDFKGHVRPWDRTIQIRVMKGFMKEGDTVTVRLGDTRRGSPGIRVQTFVEDSFEFKVLVDPIATGLYTEVPQTAAVRIVAGPPATWKAVLPTLRRIGEGFRLCLKAEDKWGNVCASVPGRYRLTATGAVAGLPDAVDLGDSGTCVIENLIAGASGDMQVILTDDGGRELARSNPMRVARDAELIPFWGDLHGQSEETIGTNAARSYFKFARDKAFCDVACHQGNDFQITRAFYDDLNRLTAEFNTPGRFITVPGYEWSGNTNLGGDRNVYFAGEIDALHRSSHALVSDESDLGEDCNSAADLFQRLRASGYDVLTNAHVGGRYADVRLAHDGVVERSMEVHSAWGTFEWLLEDALDMGYRVGVVSNSDDHKGRPGASYPGASTFGAYGGLTCLLLPELTRSAVMECLRKRHHYGTTGNRMLLSVEALFDEPATLFDEDPALGAVGSGPVRRAIMGDIVHTRQLAARFRVSVAGSAPIERVELRRGREVLETIRPYSVSAESRRIRVIWEGAEYRGRGRQTIWDGEARLNGNRFERAQAINFWNADRPLRRDGEAGLSWQALTTGNFGGFDLWLERPDAGRLALRTPLLETEIEIAEIGAKPRVWELGGLGRRLRVQRLPELLSEATLDFERTVVRDAGKDAPVYVSVFQEDGFQSWSSPIYLIKD